MTTQVRVPDNGFQLLIARLVGEVDEGVLALRPDDEVHYTTVECIDRDGTVTRTRRPWTDEEREEVAEGAKSYLTDAGVEPFPRGIAVYLTLPEGVESWDEFIEQLFEDFEQPNFPDQVAAAMRPVILKRYRLGRPQPSRAKASPA